MPKKRLIVTSVILLLIGLLLITVSKLQLSEINSSGLTQAANEYEQKAEEIINSYSLGTTGIDLRHKLLAAEKELRTKYKEYEDQEKIWNIFEEIGWFVSASILVHLLYHFSIRVDEVRVIMTTATQVKTEVDQAIETAIAQVNSDALKKATDEYEEKAKQVINSIFKSSTEWGFSKIHDKVSYSEIFNNLKEGDELLLLDTYCPHINVAIPELKKAIAGGATIKMLIIDPFSEITNYRSEEIYRNALQHERFRTGVKEFIDELESCISDEGGNKKNLQILTYSDLPCIPFYLHLSNGMPINAIQGFYLNSSSGNFMHIEWNHTSKGMTNYLNEYFQYKWQKWSRIKSINLAGKWNYCTYREGDKEKNRNEGYCYIEQFGNKLKFEGYREWVWKDGEKSQLRYHMPWESDWALICEDGIIRGDYNINTQVPPITKLPGYIKLKIEKNEDGEISCLRGKFDILESTNDVVCNIPSGSILFELQQYENPDLIQTIL
jgi:hypothetical protein